MLAIDLNYFVQNNLSMMQVVCVSAFAVFHDSGLLNHKFYVVIYKLRIYEICMNIIRLSQLRGRFKPFSHPSIIRSTVSYQL